MGTKGLIIIGLAATAGALATLVSGARAAPEPIKIVDFWIVKKEIENE